MFSGSRMRYELYFHGTEPIHSGLIREFMVVSFNYGLVFCVQWFQFDGGSRRVCISHTQDFVFLSRKSESNWANLVGEISEQMYRGAYRRVSNQAEY